MRKPNQSATPKNKSQPKLQQSKLEPSDWNTFRSLGRQMIDDMTEYLETIEHRPVWQPVPKHLSMQLSTKLPTKGISEEKAYQEFKELILQYQRGNVHPRFWGWVNGSGVPFAALADFLASITNSTLGSGENAPMQVEDQVISWFKEMFSWPESGSGVLTSGCSMGQIIGLSLARQRTLGKDVRTNGITNAPQLVVYGSSETHHSIEKTLELLGLGSNSFQKIPVTKNHQIDTSVLRHAIALDRNANRLPMCIIANAGTVNTGAIDPLSELREIADEENIWLHIDAAFGAAAWLSREHQPLLDGMELADSLVFDLHKWFYIPFDASCILVKHPTALEGAFGADADYISKTNGGPLDSNRAFSDRGIEQSRRFRALKIWMSLKAYGLEAFSNTIRNNLKQARYLASLVNLNSSLELIFDGPLNIVCFRYNVPHIVEEERLDETNRNILSQLQTSGVAMPSQTTINGKFVIRVAINNHRTSINDLDIFIEKVLEIGDKLAEAT